VPAAVAGTTRPEQAAHALPRTLEDRLGGYSIRYT